MTVKTCIQCHIEKPETEYYKYKDKPFNPCKECCKFNRKAYYAINKVKIRAYSSKYMKENKRKLRIYRRKHRERIRKYFRDYYAKHKEQLSFKRKLKRDLQKAIIEQRSCYV